jgi:hypothetical protein
MSDETVSKFNPSGETFVGPHARTEKPTNVEVIIAVTKSKAHIFAFTLSITYSSFKCRPSNDRPHPFEMWDMKSFSFFLPFIPRSYDKDKSYNIYN